MFDDFFAKGFVPRSFCGDWSPAEKWLHILSDVAIFLAYFTIPCLLVYFGVRRKDLPFRWLFWLFAIFIFACGTTHLMEAIIFWWPGYRLAGIIKLVTAVASWATVAALIPITPQALTLRSPQELERQIGERESAEVLLRESEAKFRGLLEAAPDGIVIFDTAGRITLVNAQTEKLVGRDRQSLLDRAFEDLFPDRLRAWHADFRREYFMAPHVRPMGTGLQLWILRGDGIEVPVEISLSPLQTEKGLLAIAAIRDITERKRTEAQLLQNERLAGIGQTVAGLAHEGRNALQQIQACVEILRLKLTGDNYVLDLVSGIEKSQDRLHRLFEEVRSFAAPLKIERRRCNIAEIWNGAWQQLQVTRKDRDATLHVNGGGADLTCEVDPFHLEQVFRNLLENSLAACHDPVAIAIECSYAALDEMPALKVVLRDNGPGFKPDQLARLFDAFYTTKTHGTGLGLAIVKRIVEAHSGSISASSPAGGGAEIQIILPRNALGSGTYRALQLPASQQH